MKASVTFKEVTTKTIKIEGDDLEKIREKADYYATEDVSVIDFEKNPNSYEVTVIDVNICEELITANEKKISKIETQKTLISSKSGLNL